MNLADICHHFILDYDSNTRIHSLRITTQITTALKGWSAYTRISPAWPILPSGIRSTSSRGVKAIAYAFLGPVNPAKLEVHYGKGLTQTFATKKFWATLGSLNLIVALSNKEEIRELTRFAKAHKLTYEIWTVESKDNVKLHSTGTFSDSRRQQANDNTLSVLPTADVALSSHLQEFATLIASGKGRGTPLFQWISKDLTDVDAGVLNPKTIKTISSSRLTSTDLSRVLYDLANANAGLSRFVSQALSGVPPIFKTECHFWPHSLLGTGIANCSLRAIVNFITRAVGAAHIPDRIEALKDLPYSGKNLIAREPDFFHSDLLDQRSLPTDLDAPFNPVCYYSGRDGFKNDLYTASAPLASIIGCNSRQWNLYTITHELSHRIVSAVIARLLPLNLSEIERNYSLLTDHAVEPANYFDAARQYLSVIIQAVAEIDNENVVRVIASGPATYQELIASYINEIEELLVHAFDYLYFYQERPEEYVKGIWISWGVIPNISSRTVEYVIRTLTAISTSLIRVKNWEAEARATMLRALKKSDIRSVTSYADEAIAILENEDTWNNSLKKKLVARHHIACFARLFLYSRKTVIEVSREQLARSQDDRAYENFNALTLTERQFENPLLFIRHFAQDAAPNSAKSVWLHHMLAFSTLNEELV